MKTFEKQVKSIEKKERSLSFFALNPITQQTPKQKLISTGELFLANQQNNEIWKNKQN